MRVVRECIDAFPFTADPYVIERRETLLLAEPLPAQVKTLRTHAPIAVTHFGTTHVRQAFAPPRGVYESQDIRIEWQNMQGRQPFYHRNCGVDELSFQVCGERTLMSELGTVELRPGDFSRLPDGVAHDNFGRQDVHLLFYLPGPVAELMPEDRTAQYEAVPFVGWQAAVINELVTEGVGGPGQDLVFAPTDETLLLQHAQHDSARIRVLRATSVDLQWLYRSAGTAIGHMFAHAADGCTYTRHRDADEIQYQISGHRILVTQRGVVQLVPGDFVQIPRGVAFTSIHCAPSAHIALVSVTPIPRVAPIVRQGERLTPERLEALRNPE